MTDLKIADQLTHHRELFMAGITERLTFASIFAVLIVGALTFLTSNATLPGNDLAKAIAIIVVSLLSITAVFISMKIHRVLDYRDSEMSHLLAAGNNKEIVTSGKDYTAKKALIKAIDQNNRDLAFSLLKDICDRNMGKRKSIIYKIFTSIGNLFTAFFVLCGILSLTLGLYLLVTFIVCRK